MSYILDALKKSDQERKRGDVPNLQTVHIPINAEPQTPFILYGFIFLLLIALAFVIGLVVSLSDGEVVQKVEGDSIETHKSTEPVKQFSLPKHKNKIESVVEVQIERAAKPVQTPQSTEKEIKKVLKKKVEPMKASVSTEKQAHSVTEEESLAVKIANMNDIPYLHEMPDYRQQSVPDMSFAGHVYSSKPSSRSVIINGEAMSEGDVIVQGLNVVEITPSGVVFSLHDELFRMDILQDWSFE